MGKKPVGKTGPMAMSSGGAKREFVDFPSEKEKIEELIVNLFLYATQHIEDELKPFSDPIQNQENDIDYSMNCAKGPVFVELTEFAPLGELGLKKHTDAPGQFSVGQMAQAAYNLIMKKSGRYSVENKILIVYKTQEEFFITPPVREMLRRMFEKNGAPTFWRVYGLSPHSTTMASIDMIYPNKPHDFFTHLPDDQLAAKVYQVGFQRMVTFKSYAQYGWLPNSINVRFPD